MSRFVLVLLLAACAADAPELSPSGYRGADVADSLPLPDVVLTDTDGQPYALAEATRGKVTLVFFGYTHCPDICPVHLANIAAVLDKLPDAVQRDIVTLFVTTDPSRDSLPRLRQWVKQFNPQFVGLTGPDSVLARAQHALRLVPAVADTAHGLVQHAGQVIAFSRDGLARVQYPFGTRQRDWAHDLPRLVAEGE